MSETRSTTGVRSEVVLGLGVMAMLFILIIPLPPFLLDVFIATNLAFATLLMLITLSAKEPLELSTYPTLLLLTTLFRLALNVASTRLILLKGQAGNVIQAFGDFVVGGDLVVGITIFAILIIIQFIVITKGSTRISEVAARFTLDAMPGKQMAIDADLNSGLISEDQARERREKISQEAEFYGAMDGASKFVRGDAIAGLIINLVNILGGVVIGMSAGLSIGDALKKYSILTVGDGLVSQTPALIIAVAAGVLVTKTSSKRRFSNEFAAQLLGSGRSLGIGAVAVALLALVPGFPKLPFVALAVTLAIVARRAARKKTADAEADATVAPAGDDEDSPELSPEALGELLAVDRMGIEIGYRLIALVESDRDGGLLQHIAAIRRQFAKEQGLIVPPIRLRDNLTLDANAYRILIAGQEVARGEVYPGHYMAMNPGTASGELEGIAALDPTFGLPATWVREDRKTEAEALGYTVVDAVSVLVTHLTETIRSHAAEIMTRQDVQTLIDRIKESSPAVVDELIPDVLSLGDLQRVLQNLVAERIPIKNLTAILECLADQGRKIKDPDELTEFARQRLARTLCEMHRGRDGAIRAIVIEPQVEAAIEAALSGRDGAVITPSLIQTLKTRIAETFADAVKQGHEPVVVARATTRRYLAEMLRGLEPRVAVLSFNEVVHAPRVEPVAQVTVEAPADALAAGASA